MSTAVILAGRRHAGAIPGAIPSGAPKLIGAGPMVTLQPLIATWQQTMPMTRHPETSRAMA